MNEISGNVFKIKKNKYLSIFPSLANFGKKFKQKATLSFDVLSTIWDHPVLPSFGAPSISHVTAQSEIDTDSNKIRTVSLFCDLFGTKF